MPFLIVVLTLFAGFLVADAKVGAAVSNVPDSVRVEQVLTAGQIDSSTVDVGAFVVVIYGQGERHPVSGAWTQLDTVRGSIKAVDSRRLIVGLAPDGWSKRIALERIQTLSLIGAPLLVASDSTERVGKFPVQEGNIDQTDPDKRVAQKLTYGALWGAGGGAVGAVVGLALGSLEDCSDCPHGHNCDLCGLGPIVGSLIVGSIGCSIGTAVGVSRADPHDLFGASLIGSVVGFIGGIWLVSATESELLLPSLFIGPIVGATLASEWSRSLNPSGKKLPLFMNLVPDPRGRFSAIATLRF